jgi:hypothetical protein
MCVSTLTSTRQHDGRRNGRRRGSDDRCRRWDRRLMRRCEVIRKSKCRSCSFEVIEVKEGLNKLSIGSASGRTIWTVSSSSYRNITRRHADAALHRQDSRRAYCIYNNKQSICSGCKNSLCSVCVFQHLPALSNTTVDGTEDEEDETTDAAGGIRGLCVAVK